MKDYNKKNYNTPCVVISFQKKGKSIWTKIMVVGAKIAMSATCFKVEKICLVSCSFLTLCNLEIVEYLQCQPN